VTRKTYPGRIDELPSGTLRLRLFLDGETYSYTFPDEEREDVESFARQEYNRLEAIHRRGKGATRRVSDQLHIFEEDHVPSKAPATRRKYMSALKGIKRFFVKKQGDPRVRSVTPDDVRAYLAWRRTHGLDGSKREEPLAKSTLRQQRAVLSAVFSCRGDHNPVPDTPAPQPDQREAVLLLGERAELYDALLEAAREHASPMLYPFVVLIGETGVRPWSEGLWVQWSDLALDYRVNGGEDTVGMLTVVSRAGEGRTKSGSSRKVPLTPLARSVLRDHMATFRMRTYDGARSPWVFHHTTSDRTADAGDRIGTMRGALETAAESAGLPEAWQPRDLRTRRSVKWLREGHSPRHVQQALGHEDIKTTMKHYDRWADDEVAGLVLTGNRGRLQGYGSVE
jgi:integrase